MTANSIKTCQLQQNLNYAILLLIHRWESWYFYELWKNPASDNLIINVNNADTVNKICPL